MSAKILSTKCLVTSLIHRIWWAVMIIQIACYRWESSIKISHSVPKQSLSLQFNNGSEAITKIPFKHASTPFLTTPSKVATLMFGHAMLGLLCFLLELWCRLWEPHWCWIHHDGKMGSVKCINHWHEIQNSQVMVCFKDLLAVENKFKYAPFSQIGRLKNVSLKLQQCFLFLDGQLPIKDPETECS